MWPQNILDYLINDLGTIILIHIFFPICYVKKACQKTSPKFIRFILYFPSYCYHNLHTLSVIIWALLCDQYTIDLKWSTEVALWSGLDEGNHWCLSGASMFFKTGPIRIWFSCQTAKWPHTNPVLRFSLHVTSFLFLLCLSPLHSLSFDPSICVSSNNPNVTFIWLLILASSIFCLGNYKG